MVDKVVGALLISPIFLCWFAYRRWQEYAKATKACADSAEQIEDIKADLKRQVARDSLTGLPTRIVLEERLKQAMETNAWAQGYSAVVCLDIDDFSPINNQFGYSAGDELLKTFSQRFLSELRKGDTLSRMGEDEFICLIPLFEQKSEVLKILHRLLEAATQPMIIEQAVVKLSASIGVAFFAQGEAISSDELIRRAKFALAEAKAKGKNCSQVYEHHSTPMQGEQYLQLDQVQRALTQNEFVLYYQPQVNLKNEQVIGAEALIRWNHPERGLLLPGEFMPLLEQSPIGIKVSEWVIETAISQIQKWYKQGINMAVSVNINAHHLMHPSFFATLNRLANKYSLRRSTLTLEIVESCALQDIDYVRNIILQCSEIGIDFSMDDFGTGYSSLTYLRQLPLTELKIDRSFVSNMLSNDVDVEILTSILKLAEIFGCRVVAEGVEYQQQIITLQRLGCDLVQGFGIAEPMPTLNLERWLDNWNSEDHMRALLEHDAPEIVEPSPEEDVAMAVA
ncbi:putative bifunctional diguanylate cyclase/phosphodiesterase [Parendozoicomonas haliclonae]|nr:bifunctional diguanylate cyclase/phosphodiesterase [Parendozoicomonas haliclonae]